jgi:hypothetical protein
MNIVKTPDQPEGKAKKTKVVPSKKSAKTWPIFQVKISLLGIKPIIWRRLLVSGGCTLHKFHVALQIAMGWGDCHLHQFLINNISYGNLADGDDDTVDEDEKNFRLADLVQEPKTKISYDYDYGDGWEHVILIEKTNVPAIEYPGHPICLAGAHACPPEDCGGVPGYYAILEALEDPDHPDHEDFMDFVGPNFDPAFFNIQAVNRDLKRIKG